MAKFGECFEQVSIHTPTKGVTISGYPQNNYIIVSIHTPTKGVTHCLKECTPLDEVSIHTPTKGVTCSPLQLASL